MNLMKMFLLILSVGVIIVPEDIFIQRLKKMIETFYFNASGEKVYWASHRFSNVLDGEYIKRYNFLTDWNNRIAKNFNMHKFIDKLNEKI